MPDLINVLANRWKFILMLTLGAGLLAFILASLKSKQYLAVATALPVNTAVSDKARIFNENIEGLYSNFGTTDELDRLEGTASLDTLYLAIAQEANLAAHYKIIKGAKSLYHAALELKSNSKISRSAYGELKFKAWDKDPATAAMLSNSLLEKLQALRQHLQNQNNILTLQKLQSDYSAKQQQFRSSFDSVPKLSGADAEIQVARKNALLLQLSDYERMIDQYYVASSTNAPVLFVVEKARAPLMPDKPRIFQSVLFALGAAFVFAFLVSVFLDSRKQAQ